MAMGGKNERGYRIGVEEASSGFIVPTLSPSLQASQAIGDPSDQVAYVVAAPLSHGSNPNSNMAGRRREDDENLVIPSLTRAMGNNAAHPGNGGLDELASATALAGAGVRRLTPTECERLQALPDGWTQLGTTADSKRYAALGDAVTASVSEWIGRRLLEAM